MKHMKEIGGFRELDLRTGYEYYKEKCDIIRLNSGRAGIFHSLRLFNCNKILVPYYECSTVKEFLIMQNIDISFYCIDKNFRPILNFEIENDTALLIVNYFGLMSKEEEKTYVSKYKKVIFDHTQAFFSPPVEDGYTVYSPRKFFGVEDGCYVIGNHAECYAEEYDDDCSGDTCSFLLKRIESGGNKNYPEYCKNEERINQSGIKKMSKITQALLDNIDYSLIKKKRIDNYIISKKLFANMNLLPESLFSEESMIPMVYPLYIEDINLRYYLKERHIYVGQWWKYLIDELPQNTFEVKYAQYLIPIQIDQRYGRKDLEYTKDLIEKYLRSKKEFI